MKEINLSKKLTSLRKEKKISQETLANFLNVSKAAVSKWETGQSYPDISLLPKLATYFDVTIDALLSYQPQLTKTEIKEIYTKLVASFTTQPFNKVINHCRDIIKTYYSCHALLLQIGALYLNYANLAKPETHRKLLHEALGLFIKVSNESHNVEDIALAQSLEATTFLMLEQPEKVIELLGDSNHYLLSTDALLATAFQMTGNSNKSEAILQINIYQHLLHLCDLMILYLSTLVDNPVMFDQTHKRALALADYFNLATLQPMLLLKLHLTAATILVQTNRNEDALASLTTYVTIATSGIFPFELHGDDYFIHLDAWFTDMNYPTPRDDYSIQQGIVDGFVDNPTFASLANDERFQNLVEKLQTKEL